MFVQPFNFSLVLDYLIDLVFVGTGYYLLARTGFLGTGGAILSGLFEGGFGSSVKIYLIFGVADHLTV